MSRRLHKKVEMIVAKHMFELEGELANTFNVETFDFTLNEKQYNKLFDEFTDLFTNAIKEYDKETA